MRRFWLVALAVASLAPSAAAVEEGSAAPLFSVPLLDGDGTLSLAEYRGKVVYLDFWASWCAPCLVSLPLLEELRREFPGERFQILAVNVDRDSEKARRFLSERPVGYPSGADPEGRVPERFEIETMPTSFLLDGRGVIRHVHRGFRRGDVPDLRERIRRLLAQEAR